ncbi:polyprenol phosphomannose-dependent alpha 1,6 mannosyltransferase MptB [Plantactinospora sp. B6F1]|uniref:polyprenol phosphomannose-dependent alpha 1,6 mannosyltransferase MptB n=1 Tax=Plantactinospora sp. B6F1 TaxID=3158971 RepID=UPI0032D998B9
MRPVGELPSPERPNRLRLAGLAASATLSAGAYGAGAPLTGPVEAAAPDTWGYWLGLAGWVAGLAALAGIWWRLGARVRRRPASVPLGWLLRTGLLWATPLLVAPPIASRDAYAYACQGALWLDAVDPYAVGVLPGGCVWSDAVPALWRDTPSPYGPLALALAGGAVAVARLVGTSTDGQLLVAVALLRVQALAGVVLVAGFLPRLARAGGLDPVQACWLGLVSPLVLVHAVGGAHNDALVLGLVVSALSLAAGGPSAFGTPMMRLRRGASRAGLGAAPGGLGAAPGGLSAAPGGLGASRAGFITGALLGLAVAIKITAIVALPFALLIITVRPGVLPDRRQIAASVTAGSAGSVLAFAAVTRATGLDLGWISALSDTGRLVQWTSVPTGLGMAAGYLLRLAGQPDAVDAAVTAARLLGFVALAGAIAALLVRAGQAVAAPDPTRARRRLVTLTGLAFTALALLSPIFYPWYGLIAVTVLAAGLRAWRQVHRVAVAVIVLSFLVLPGGLGLAVLTKLPGALFDVALVAVLTAVAYRRWRSRSRR